jgi:hypothetical protein
MILCKLGNKPSLNTPENKDLDKPLDLTDSEKYALRFGLDLIHSSSTISEVKKVNI